MTLSEDIKKFLPQYLTEESTQVLLKELEAYCVDGTTNKVYSIPPHEDKTIYQGDGISNLAIVNIAISSNGGYVISHKEVPAIIISNTCDILLENDRKRPFYVCYAPLVKYEAFYTMIAQQFGKQVADNQCEAIKAQKITDLLYLPQGGNLDTDYIALLGRICSMDNRLVSRDNLNETRLFSLSNFGFYLFLLKLSIHLNRVQEKVDRTTFIDQGHSNQ